MREAFMATQKRASVYLKGMTLRANVDLGDFGACRRR